jgi:hypothetical protein
MKTTTMQTAFELADNEADAGRNVMILFPDLDWTGRTTSSLRSDSRGTIYTRCTTCHAGLKLVSIDTLILVAPDSPTWDAEGEAYARERLRTSRAPQVIKVGEGSALDVCFFCDKSLSPTSGSFRWALVHSHVERCCLKCFPKHKERWVS